MLDGWAGAEGNPVVGVVCVEGNRRNAASRIREGRGV